MCRRLSFLKPCVIGKRLRYPLAQADGRDQRVACGIRPDTRSGPPAPSVSPASASLSVNDTTQLQDARPIGHRHSFATLDDLLRGVFEEIISTGVDIAPSKGPATELAGVLLELQNPRARLSRTETRGKPFSCLGELCWYLSGRDDLNLIEYYIPAYRHFSDEGHIFGAYGPRLRNEQGHDQIINVLNRLRDHHHSRRAVIQLFRASDLVAAAKDIPCTCTLQFLRRDGLLHLLTYMRSNDAYIGLPHDIFFFTMLQELVACALNLDLGSYKHIVGSLHLYRSHRDTAEQFLGEGWQSTTQPMPAMPQGNPWIAVESLLDAEKICRGGRPLPTSHLEGLDPYWCDLLRLLDFLRIYKDQNIDEARALRDAFHSTAYYPFLNGKIRSLRDAADRSTT